MSTNRSTLKFGLTPLPQRGTANAYMKSLFGLKPLKPKAEVVEEITPEPETTETLYFYVTWQPY